MGEKKDIKAEWLTRSFRASEFACKCRSKGCDAPKMKGAFLTKLQAMRDAWAKPLSPTRGASCAVHNQRIGGATKSRHLEGDAADFWFANPKDAKAFAALAEKCGMTGIGLGRHKVHVDDRPGGPARWTYDD